MKLHLKISYTPIYFGVFTVQALFLSKMFNDRSDGNHSFLVLTLKKTLHLIFHHHVGHLP